MSNLSECCNEYIVEDERVGDQICTGCARATRYIPQEYNETVIPFHGCAIERELRDICANHNLPEVIYLRAVYLLHKERKISREVSARCLHAALTDCNAPRTYKEISSMYFVPTTSINDTDTNELKPSQLIERTLRQLEIIEVDVMKKIGLHADVLFEGELCSVSPQSALAVAIALVKPHLCRQKIANSCHISKQTLHKHLRRISIKGREF